MPEIRVFDAPVCAPGAVQDARAAAILRQFAADLEWLASQGVTVERCNAADYLETFGAGDLAAEGALPLIVVDGSVASCGGYPTRQELAVLAGIATRPRPDRDRPRSAIRVLLGKCCG